MDLKQLLDPNHTVIVTQECQRGVIGPESVWPALAASARETGTISNIARIVKSGRGSGCNVIHAIAAHRSDLRGANHNAQLFRASERRRALQLVGTPLVEVVEEIGVADTDLVSTRFHGLSPIAGTDVAALLTNLGCRTVVMTGVSTNVGVTNGVFDAVNLGFDVVVARDAITGFPAQYTDVIIENTLSLVATITTSDAMIECWQKAN